MTISRRYFLRNASAVALGFGGLQTLLRYENVLGAAVDSPGYGSLVPDPEGIIDLPEGFSYRIISRAAEQMDDRFFVPRAHDGMAAFPGPRGLTILVRNHELNTSAEAASGPFGEDNRLARALSPDQIYDAGHEGKPALGGTTTLIYDTRSQRLEGHYLSLTGTLRNCAGGPTPWNTWVTCEETVERAGEAMSRNHGYNFEVPVSDRPRLAEPIPLKAMGRFNHEAIAVDPDSGIVYETEDRGDGLIYRFIPNSPDRLADGGRLQALCVRDRSSLDTRNWENQELEVGSTLEVYWIDLEEIDSPNDDLRIQGFERGAACFARGEGMWYGRGGIYFACTNGGSARKGQIWKYTPTKEEGRSGEEKAPGRLQLFVEPNDATLVENADNLTVTPWGDLIVCEDGPGECYMVGVTPQGKLYRFGRNTMNESEMAGATFSPDGSTFFVNIQNPGLTLAITGPWKKKES